MPRSILAPNAYCPFAKRNVRFAVMDFASLIPTVLPSTVALRHRLHQIPELSYQEHQTAAAIRAELDRIGLPYLAGVDNAPTATVAWIGDTSKPCIALRADIDALPIQERTGFPYASMHPGRMHACGHDGHTAALLATATVLNSVAAELPVCVKFFWQPAEEGGGGAERLIHAGVLDGRLGPRVFAIFGLHGWPGIKIGTVACKSGAQLAATDGFKATFVGRGCHGAYPHFGRDPVVTACEAVLNLQQFVSREMDPTDSAVVTVGMIHAGTAINIIPDRATIEGTARTITPHSRHAVRQSIQRRCEGIAAANQCQVEFTWSEGYPATVNDPDMADRVARIAKEALGINHYLPVARPSMAGEDFAFYLEKIPGCFFFIGVEPLDQPDYPSLHTDLYDFPDDALVTGIRMFCEIVKACVPPAGGK